MGCRKDEQDVDGKIKEHAQWCRVRTRIMGRGMGTACYLVNRSLSSAFGGQKLHMRYGLVRNPLLNISKCLVVMLMYMFQRKIGVRWIIN
jgi:hypothetical protein